MAFGCFQTIPRWVQVFLCLGIGSLLACDPELESEMEGSGKADDLAEGSRRWIVQLAAPVARDARPQLRPLVDRDIALTPLFGTTSRAAERRLFALDTFFVIDAGPGRAGAIVVDELRQVEGVLSVQPDANGQGGELVPNDTYVSEQWSLVDTQDPQDPEAAPSDMDAPPAWEITQGNSATIVAVLDTGIDTKHPEFAGRVLPGYDFVNDDANAEGDHYHGTSAAGILAATGNNNFGIAGIAWRPRILPVKVLDQFNQGQTSVLAEGIVYAAEQGADILSMSLINYPCDSEVLAAALAYAQAQGAILVSAAGNSGVGDADHSGPGCYAETISVGATQRDGSRAWYSATGSALDLVAAADQVPTVKFHDAADVVDEFNGTSAACPAVAGTIALMLDVRPGLTAQAAKDLLDATADGSQTGWNDELGWGRLNIHRAVVAARED